MSEYYGASELDEPGQAVLEKARWEVDAHPYEGFDYWSQVYDHLQEEQELVEQLDESDWEKIKHAMSEEKLSASNGAMNIGLGGLNSAALAGSAAFPPLTAFALALNGIVVTMSSYSLYKEFQELDELVEGYDEAVDYAERQLLYSITED